jgi:hypothetical protein
MFDSTSFTQDMMSNPTKLSKVVIDGMRSTDTTDTLTINDPNNGFTLMLFTNMCVYANFSQKIDLAHSFLYPQRSRTAEQLYTHLSEFDYVKLMASPATLPFTFVLGKKWIIDNGVYFDSNYNKIVIPATSYITMGNIVYSMYYPIEILVNRNTGLISAFYDITTQDPLNAIGSNTLLDTRTYTKDGIELFQFSFNMYQFARTRTDYTLSPKQGFINTLSYDDEFYAVRVYTLQNGAWNELAYALSSLNYDFTTPTALITLLSDQSRIKIEIPTIYFDNGQISKTVRVELYTSKGAVNYTLSSADVQGIKANFDTASSIYAAPVTQPSIYAIVPNTTEVAGGSDPMTYQEIRDAVVNQRLYDRVPVTPQEVTEAGKRAGFNLTRQIDDLTERMYYASNVLKDANGSVVPTFVGNIRIADDSLNGNPSTILPYTDGYYTLLPTTTFKIAPNGTTCVPMTDGEVASLNLLTPLDLAAELNKGIYVRQPFHITLLTNMKSPQATVYNLLTPAMTSLVFERENAHSAPQMSVTSCVVTHRAAGTGGYQISVGITRSDNIIHTDPALFKIWLTTRTKVGTFAYLPLTYVSTDSNGIDTWVVQLDTNYHITTDDDLQVSMYNLEDTMVPVQVGLSHSFTVLTSFDPSYDPAIPIDIDLNLLLPPSQKNKVVVMTQQTLSLTLGTNLSRQIYCAVTTSWGNSVYALADATSYYTTNIPIFQINEAGVLNTRINTSTHNPEILQLYAPGDTPVNPDDIDVVLTAPGYAPEPGTASTTTFSVADTTGLLVGASIRGLYLPVAATITAVTPTTVTITGLATSTLPVGTVLTMTNPHPLLRTSVNQGAPGVQLTVASTTGLLVGQTVSGFDIPAGNTIASVDSPTTFSLTTPTSAAVAGGTLLTISNRTAHGVVKHAKGDILTDASGQPIVVQAAKNQYLVPSILFDGRLFASQNPADKDVVTSISQRLQNYTNQIATIAPGLLENSDVYYKPTRSMGPALFGIGNNQTITLPLELSFSATLYVDESVINTPNLQTTMESTILAILNTAIQQPTISMSDVAETTKSQLGSNVAGVEFGDISGVPGLRFMALQQSDVSPSIENFLVLQSDNTVLRVPNVKITFLPKPDTAESITITGTSV